MPTQGKHDDHAHELSLSFMKTNLFLGFVSAIYALHGRPYEFCDQAEQEQMVKRVLSALDGWEEIFLRRHLAGEKVYNDIVEMRACFSSGDLINEAAFATALARFMRRATLAVKVGGEDWASKLKTVEDFAAAAAEYHVAMEKIARDKTLLSHEQQQEKDKRLIADIGIFYILEYTIFIMANLPRMDENERRKAFFDGVTIGKNRLMPYKFYAQSFYRELCLKVLDDGLRRRLYDAFYDFDQVFMTANIVRICPAYRDFNARLIEAFRDFGVNEFKAVFLKIFRSDVVKMDDLLAYVKGVKV